VQPEAVKILHTTQYVDVPEGVKITAKCRKVVVKGPRTILRRDFRHLPISISIVDGGKRVKVSLTFGKRKQVAAIRTVCTHIRNLIVGVTVGYEFKMRLVYAHFPIKVNIENDNKTIELRNFLGEARVRTVNMIADTKVDRGGKDELVISGSDLDAVSQSAANIQQVCLVRNKDIRKFLDGIYVSEKGNIVKPED